MKTEFNLSERIEDGKDKSMRYSDIVRIEDVKEFIRLLKEELVIKLDLKTIYPKDYKIVMDMINKLAGDKLR